MDQVKFVEESLSKIESDMDTLILCPISYEAARLDNWRTSRAYVRLLFLAYAWFWTCICWHARPFFPYAFKKFQNFSGSSNFILFKNLLLYIWPLFMFFLARGRFFTVYICFKETIFFNFLYKLFNISPHLRALANLVRK